MLSVQDNFLRALDEMKKVEETDEVKTLKEGVAMVAHQMDGAMEKFDINLPFFYHDSAKITHRIPLFA